MNSFKIEDTTIEYSFDELSSEEMSIKSLPYNYLVSFVDKETIETELEKAQAKNKEKHFIYIDGIVADLYKDVFSNYDQLTLVAKEGNKTLPVATKLLDKLQEKNFTKQQDFLTVGGGITQDISAFARAVFKRGINWTYIPTTLLAMGDSCIGAKSCLNYGKIKNQLGLFSAPKKVFIYTDLLKTLHPRDVLSGYGEILKLAIVGGKPCIEKFIELTKDQKGDFLLNIEQLIKLSLTVKKSVIEIDEFESDIRKALNYGHTIGHAIEPIVNYKIPHGIAVSIGMIVENLLAAEYGSLPKSDADYLNNIISNFIDKTSLTYLENISIETIISNMKRDKKAMSNDIYISVPFNIGFFDMLKVTSDKNLENFLTLTFKILVNK